MNGPLSNPSPRSGENAYEPDEPTRRIGIGPDGSFREDPPVMRRMDGTAIREAVSKSGIAQRPAPGRNRV